MKLLKLTVLCIILWAPTLVICSAKDTPQDQVQRLELILKNAPNFDVDAPIDPKYKLTFLMGVAQTGNVPLLEETLKKAKNIEAQDINQRTAIFHAVIGGHLESVQTLIKAGARVHTADKNGKTPIAYAADNFRMLQVFAQTKPLRAANLVQAKKAANSREAAEAADQKRLKLDPKQSAATVSQHSAALCKACVDGTIADVRRLTAEKDAKVNAPDELGQSPLTLAAMFGRIPVVQHLVSLPDILLNQIDLQGKNPFHYAVAYGNLEVAQILQQEDVSCIKNKDVHGQTPLSTSVLVNDPELTQWLLDNGADTELHYQDMDLIAFSQQVTRESVLEIPNYRIKQEARIRDFAKNKAAIQKMLRERVKKSKSVAQPSPLMASIRKLQEAQARQALDKKLKEKLDSLTATIQGTALEDAQVALKKQKKNARKRANKKRNAQKEDAVQSAAAPAPAHPQQADGDHKQAAEPTEIDTRGLLEQYYSAADEYKEVIKGNSIKKISKLIETFKTISQQLKATGYDGWEMRCYCDELDDSYLNLLRTRLKAIKSKVKK
jgi:ankyrin repeat protein